MNKKSFWSGLCVSVLQSPCEHACSGDLGNDRMQADSTVSHLPLPGLQLWQDPVIACMQTVPGHIYFSQDCSCGRTQWSHAGRQYRVTSTTPRTAAVAGPSDRMHADSAGSHLPLPGLQLWQDPVIACMQTVPGHIYLSQGCSCGRTQWQVADPGLWGIVLLYPCVNSYHCQHITWLTAMMNTLRRDEYFHNVTCVGCATKTCIISGCNPIAVIPTLHIHICIM